MIQMNSSFIAPEQRDIFPIQYLNRTYSASKGTQSDDTLIRHIIKSIQVKIKEHDITDTLCFFLEAEDSDGISWSLEYILNKLRQTFEKYYFRIICDNKNPESLPQISQLITEKVFVRLANRYRLMPSFERFFSVKTVILTFMFFSLSALLIVFEQALKNLVPKNPSEVLKIFVNPAFYIIILIVTLISYLVKKRLSNKPVTRKEAIEVFEQKIQDNEVKNSKRYKNFIEACADILLRELPGITIIENYEYLDLFTQEVIKFYLSRNIPVNGIDIWIISQSSAGNSLKLNFQLDKYISAETFNLKLLDYKEKEILQKRYNLKEENLNYKTVKEICEGKPNEEYINQIVSLIRQYLISNPITYKNFNEIDLLFLISLNTKPNNLFHSVEYFVKGFKSDSERDLVRNIVLNEFFKNSPFTRTKLIFQFNKIFSELNPLIEKRNDEFRVVHGVFETFQSLRNEIILSDPRIGHLYWAIYHGDKLQVHACQLMWTRTLIHHLLRIDYLTLEKFEANNGFNKILISLFNYHLKAIDLSIRTSYTNEIFLLLKNTLLLFSYENLNSNVTLKNNFIKKAWQAYSIVFDDRILELIIKVAKNNNLNASQGTGHENILETLFFETIPFETDSEVRQKLNLFCLDSTIVKNSKAYSNYFRTLSAWYAISLYPASLVIENLIISKAAKSSYTYLETKSEALKRINTINSLEEKEIDFRTLSVSIWASALLLKYTDISKTVSSEYLELLEFIDKVLEEVVKCDRQLITTEEAIYSATYYFKGLLFELSVISLAAILIPLKYHEELTYNADALIFVNKIISKINEIVKTKIKNLDSLSSMTEIEFIKQINELFEFSRMIWGRLGLTVIENQLTLRYLQFLLDSIPNNNELLKRLNDLNLPINNKDFPGVFCNLVLANGLNYRELKSHYFINATRMLQEYDFGKKILNELSLIIIVSFHHSKSNLDSVFLNLLNNEKYFENWLKDIDDEEFTKLHLVQITQSIGRTRSQKLQKQVLKILKDRNDNIKNEDIKLEADKWYSIMELKNKFHENQKIDIDSVLEYWKDKKTSWLYAGVLDLLIKNNYFSDEIKNDCFESLKAGISSDYPPNAYILLAHTLTQVLTGPDLEIPLQCLESHITLWETDLNIDLVISIYEVLIKYSVYENQYYLDKLEELETIRWIKNHLEVIPLLLKKGSYYILFKEYFNALKRYKLPLDINTDDLFRKLTNRPEENEKILYSWKRGGSIFPDMILISAEGAVINSDFILIGDLLLSDRFVNDPFFDNDRQKLNKIVENQMYNLFSLIKKLDLPAFFVEILNEFIEKYNYTVPE